MQQVAGKCRQQQWVSAACFVHWQPAMLACPCDAQQCLWYYGMMLCFFGLGCCIERKHIQVMQPHTERMFQVLTCINSAEQVPLPRHTTRAHDKCTRIAPQGTYCNCLMHALRSSTSGLRTPTLPASTSSTAFKHPFTASQLQHCTPVTSTPAAVNNTRKNSFVENNKTSHNQQRQNRPTFASVGCSLCGTSQKQHCTP
jgi:hypothetical protein